MSNRQIALFSSPFFPFWVIMLVLCYLAKDHVFFWDTIQLGSKHGHWYYENEFQYFLLPPEIDSGHIPAFGMYIALYWFMFGKSLAVSHFAMLPFLLGVFYFAHQITKHYANGKKTSYLLLLLLLDPVFLGQSTLVSPDIALLCFFLMAWSGILQQNNTLKLLGLTFLPLVSMRGMMVVVGLFLFDVLKSQGAGEIQPTTPWIKKLFRSGWKALPWYIPGGVISLAFLLYHYQQVGWIGYHPDSPWAASYEKVGFRGIIRNIAILGWRLLDYGRVFLWLGLGVATIHLVRKKRGWNTQVMELSAFFLTLLVIMGIPMLTHKAILAHRYLLPVFFVFSLMFFRIWFVEMEVSKIFRQVGFLIVLIGLGLGNCWVYPKKVAQGWDSTMAHWPHYQVRKEMLDFIKTNDIPLTSIGTAFPEVGPMKFKDLSNNEDGFAPKDLATQSYILYANTMNDFSDAEIDELEQEWLVVKTIQRLGVCFILYQKDQ